jgi:hypothetical protein
LAGSKKNVDSLCSTWLAWDANSPEAAVVIAGNFSEDVTLKWTDQQLGRRARAIEIRDGLAIRRRWTVGKSSNCREIGDAVASGGRLVSESEFKTNQSAMPNEP